MNKQDTKNTADYFTAEKEEIITPLQLLQEIQPLLMEYFVGKFEVENYAIKMVFKNGQTFKLKVGEVV